MTLPFNPRPEDPLLRLLEWAEAYAPDAHGYCDIEKYDYADCSCGLDDMLYDARAALNRLRQGSK